MNILPRSSSNDDFEIRDNVPILDEHVLHDNDGNVIAEITAEKLELIARNNNRKIKETGDEVPLIIGHTKDNVPEDEQPPIVGYADKFRVGWLLNTGRKAIFARLKYFKNKAQAIIQYPRRSVELWLKKLEIDPISLLGASTPERALGLLKYSGHDGLHYSHTIEANSMNPDMQGIVQQVLAALQQTPEWQQLKQLLSQAGGQGQGQEQGQQAGPQQMGAEQYADERTGNAFPYDAEDYEDYDADEMGMEQFAADQFESSPHPGQKFGQSGGVVRQPQSVRGGLPTMKPTVAGKSPMRPRFDAEDYEDYGMDDGEDAQYEANASRSISAQVGGSASPHRGTSTQTFGPRNNFPGHQQSRQILGSGNMITTVPHRSTPMSHSRMQADSLRIKLARAENEINRQHQVSRGILLKLRRAEREKDLIQLESESVMFDREEEFDRGMRMNDQTWDGHLNLMRTRYQRYPVNTPAGLSGVLEHTRNDTTNSPTTREQMHEIVNHAMESGKSYEAAAQELVGSGRTY